MHTKTLAAPFELKTLATSDDGSVGEFAGYVSVYGNRDSYGDVVQPGAFTRTLAEKGNTRPLLWQHDPSRPIGQVELSDTDHGLYVSKGTITLDVPDGKAAYALLKNTPAALGGMSIGYRVPMGGEKYADGVNNLHDIDLMEGSLVTFPANTEAVVTTVKSLLDELDTDTLTDEDAQRLHNLLAKHAARKLGDAIDASELTHWKQLIAQIKTGDRH